MFKLPNGNKTLSGEALIHTFTIYTGRGELPLFIYLFLWGSTSTGSIRTERNGTGRKAKDQLWSSNSIVEDCGAAPQPQDEVVGGKTYRYGNII